ncbi:hypothetical protein D3C75_843240 [compost metagenome]
MGCSQGVSRAGNAGYSELRTKAQRLLDKGVNLIRLDQLRGYSRTVLGFIEAALAKLAPDVAGRADRQMNAPELEMTVPAEAGMLAHQMAEPFLRQCASAASHMLSSLPNSNIFRPSIPHCQKRPNPTPIVRVAEVRPLEVQSADIKFILTLSELCLYLTFFQTGSSIS